MKRKQPVILGRKAWISRADACVWAEGCPDGGEVTILGNNLETGLVTVADQSGTEWELDAAHLDTGWLYKIGARYFHESTPQAAEYLRELAEHRQGPLKPATQALAQDYLRILTRNGHELPRALAA
jgi:hypothetical protein